MQVRDLIEQLQQFDPRSEVTFDMESTDNRTGETTVQSGKDCEVKREPDTACIHIYS